MVVTFHKDVIFNDELEENEKFSWDEFVHKLKQQQLEGQVPVVSKRYAISITVFFALLFLGISQLLASANEKVILIRHRYDNVAEGYIDINITRFIPSPVYFYYELHDTFMMHRSLNQAYCKKQLITGESNECDSFKNQNYSCENAVSRSFIPKMAMFCVDNQKYYAPVGGAASIMFNDSFSLTFNGSPIAWTEEGVIADKLRHMFFEPNETNLCDAEQFRETLKPIGWKHELCEMGGYRNISLIKWLESATNKNFKKFYRILNTTKHNGLYQGVHRLYFDNEYKPGSLIKSTYPMKKFFWILHPSWVGTDQKFLEVMYLIVGTGLLALSCGLIGFQIFIMSRRKTYEDDDDY
ncbi:uncharacterized protein CELE_W03G11.2 [Caenorhabditis elegans]|uniref:Uncharacterized protein n=1 Tax=Caenorhabditis elegans TaxID=6239 RepID=Q23151_CAEEL|nr:Uncharacterized protein CELE_W03G11.2 [Caenorhabditis elegans]CAA91545.2 Uncharacterized protein CELE_W03G11.2 [Caenorhabditis elegans]|eukprot:NP_510022.2 Uncharacterized protein CELE_W03G11.2 [Caenorhabditis elegans]